MMGWRWGGWRWWRSCCGGSGEMMTEGAGEKEDVEEVSGEEASWRRCCRMAAEVVVVVWRWCVRIVVVEGGVVVMALCCWR
ncbi:hypothetical protein Tco_0868386 [Tanacetum coccineum]